jgi:hypothetical protein
MGGPHKIIIIASPQHRRQALISLLRLIPEIGEIYESENTYFLRIAPHFQPSLLLIDCVLNERTSSQHIKLTQQRFPGARCMVLLKRNSHLNNKIKVDLTLTEGFSTAEMIDNVQKLIRQTEATTSN